MKKLRNKILQLPCQNTSCLQKNQIIFIYILFMEVKMEKIHYLWK